MAKRVNNISQKYMLKNSLEFGMDCQLVTACNAFHFLTGEWIEQDSEEYKKLAKLCGCIYGSCIDISKAWRYLGIDEEYRFHRETFHNHLENGSFIEASIWHPNHGFHSCSIIGDSGPDLVILNFKPAKKNNNRFSRKRFYEFLKENPDLDTPRWTFRTIIQRTNYNP